MKKDKKPKKTGSMILEDFFTKIINIAKDVKKWIKKEYKEKTLLKKIFKKKHDDYVMERFDVSNEYGLTDEQVEIRTKHKEINSFKHSSEKSYFDIIFSNVFTFYNMLMVGVAILLLAVVGLSVIIDFSFLVVLALNIIIGTVQEIKSKITIEKLKLLNTGKVTVIRNGKEIQILPKNVVLDDILVLKAGDQVPVDCIIREDVLIEVNESLLTGESKPVKKTLNGVLYAGSYIVSGKTYALSDKVGKDTYIYSIENKAKDYKKPKSKLVVGMLKVVKILASIAIPLAVLVFWNELMDQPDDFKHAVLYGGTTIAYMIPNGLILLASIAMSTGVIKLANKHTLTQDLYSVEALSRIDTLCLDKTGTLTDGTMMVESVQIVENESDIDSIMSSYLRAFKTENQTSKALHKKYNFKATLKHSKVVEFTSEHKYSAVSFTNGKSYAVGAPEFLTNKKELLDISSSQAENGLRVLALIEVKDNDLSEKNIKSCENKEIALFMIRDNIRAEVKDTLEWFRDNDVDIKIISGDNMKTVSYIAKQAGVDGWDKCIDMSTVSKKNMEAVVMKYTIFARTTPEQKAEIVDILKKNKRTVGMTGDGVNDIIALKKADCSIALANGAPATKNVSNLVLMDSNFNNMKDAVLEGRRIVNNLQRSASLFIMKDICWLFVSLLPILLGVKHQLEPSIMSMVNVFITGIGSFFLALEPDSKRIEGNFLKTVLGKAITAGVYMFLPVMIIYIMGFCMYGLNLEAVYSFIEQMIPVISLCVIISGCVIYFKLCQPFTEYRKMLFILTISVIVFILIAIPEFYLLNSTNFMDEMILKDANSFSDVISNFFSILFRFNVYKDLTHVVVGDHQLGIIPYFVVIIFVAISSILYWMTDIFMTKLLNLTLFSNKPKFTDEEE